MSNFIKGSICLDDLFAASKAGHHAITTANNGKKYAAIIMFQNEEIDKKGNCGSIQLNKKTKDEKAVFIGNLRAQKPKEETSQNSQNDDIPF
jgi:hypothetical protein